MHVQKLRCRLHLPIYTHIHQVHETTLNCTRRSKMNPSMSSVRSCSPYLVPTFPDQCQLLQVLNYFSTYCSNYCCCGNQNKSAHHFLRYCVCQSTQRIIRGLLPYGKQSLSATLRRADAEGMGQAAPFQQFLKKW